MVETRRMRSYIDYGYMLSAIRAWPASVTAPPTLLVDTKPCHLTHKIVYSSMLEFAPGSQ